MYQPKTEAHVILNLKKLGWAKTPEPSKITNVLRRKSKTFLRIMRGFSP